jgi:hypothetical protein
LTHYGLPDLPLQAAADWQRIHIMEGNEEFVISMAMEKHKGFKSLLV